MLLRLDDQFRSKRMVAVREKAAEDLLQGEWHGEISDILDFFDGVGFLLRKGALDKFMVYSYWSHWLVPYWFAAKTVVDPKFYAEYWVNYAYLVECMKKIDRSSRDRSSAYPPSPESIAEFLTAEIESW